MAWTRFMDMHSGGSSKEKEQYIYIEAPEEEAKVIFYNRFGHNPERVTCTCCGEDYSITSGDDLAQLTGYDRNCGYDEERHCYVEKPDTRYSWRAGKGVIGLDNYLAQPNVLAIHANEIEPHERVGTIPRQGYIWVE